jgi:hypothetical protein
MGILWFESKTSLFIKISFRLVVYAFQVRKKLVYQTLQSPITDCILEGVGIKRKLTTWTLSVSTLKRKV